ncbi:DUF3455 domain-containing protein [uncultured Parasutterella sp.]|uniref:DUF3455 domain-containing protein n=1 Tax=uncultured Parasutterella sp. TaxID=1263098 RepID=UPI0025EFBCA6|nr:DUF3455 domain-containing protein [uncultured Parasutterella sp.]
MKKRLLIALTGACAAALVGCSSINTALNTSKQPSLEKLTPPSGQAFLTLEGSGIQVFRCAADSKGSYWRFEQPQAKLKDKNGEVVAELSGPMNAFEYKDGSRIISSHIIAWVDPANPQKDNKYALMKAVSDPGTGVFNGVKYIQRLKPEGGMPNSNGCTPSEAGKLLKVPFSAEYVFWK